MSAIRTGREGDSYQDSFDHILSNTEFETSQQEQQIQNELDKIKAHEKEIEEKEREIEEFASVTADTEARKEKALRQLQLNRDNISSLKHTVTVLDEHLEALSKKYQSMLQDSRDTRSQYSSAVDKYAERWEHFQSTYNSMSKARELTDKRQTLNQIKGEEAELNAKIADAKKALNATKPEGWDATVQWVLQIANVGVETEAIRCLISSTRLASLQAQEELDNSKLKSGGKLERDENMAVETEGEREGGEEEEEREGGDGGVGTLVSDAAFTDRNVEPMDVVGESDRNQTPRESPPPQQVPLVNTNPSPANTTTASPTPDNTTPREISSTGAYQEKGHREVSEPLCQRKPLGVFVRPNLPPRRFTANHPPSQQQPASSMNARPLTPSLIKTQSGAPTQSKERTSTIPPAFQLQSPRPPVSPSPRFTRTPPSPSPPTASNTTKSTLELPKFSFHLPTAGNTSASKSSRLSTVPGNTSTAKTIYSTATHREQASKSSKDTTFTPVLSVPRAPTGTSGSSRPQYQLVMPPKPSPPSVTPPPPAPISRNSTRLPAKTFVLPHQPQQSAVSRPPQSKQPPRLPKTSTAPQPSHAKLPVQPTNQTKNSFSHRPPAIDKSIPVVLAAPNPQVGIGVSHQEPQNSYDTHRETSNSTGQSYNSSETEVERIPTHQLEDMELGEEGGEMGEGEEREIGGDSSFNLSTTSINFDEQSVDFEGGSDQLEMFSDDTNTFNMSMTGSFFHTSQPQQPGEGYGFMTLSEDGGNPSSEGNMQDFFSQFGKSSSTPSGTGGSLFF